jgi:hypothetical protein
MLANGRWDLTGHLKGKQECLSEESQNEFWN